MISETKIDDSFPKGQFLIKGFSEPFRLDRNAYGGGLLFYIREDIPAKLILVEDLPTECFFIEINLRKKKWLLCCSYNPHRNNIKNHLEILGRNLDLYSSLYENIIVLGDFNVETTDPSMEDFCVRYNLNSLIKDPTCYKNPENPTCIDLILTNSPRSFQNSCVIETGLSDFHKMVVTVMKTTFQKLPPKITSYRDYKNFDNDIFRECLLHDLSQTDKVDNDLYKFLEVCINTLNMHAPFKRKYSRGNHLYFTNKELSKAIMTRTRLRNRFLKNRSDENRRKYSKQRNYCVSLLRKTKRNYYSNLNEKKITDNKKFWKTVTPFLSDKVPSNEKITLVEKDQVITNDSETAEVLNTFFSNIISNLDIPEYPDCDPLYEQISDSVLSTIVKYRYHPSITAIQRVNKSNDLFLLYKSGQR